MKRFSIFILLSLLQCATRVYAHNNGVFEMNPVVNSLSALMDERSSDDDDGVSSSPPSVSNQTTSAPTPLPTVAKTSEPTASPVTPPEPAPPKPAPAPTPDSDDDNDDGPNTSKVILSCMIVFTWFVAVTFFFVALRGEIKTFCMTCSENYSENGISGCLSSFRGSSNRRRPGLNDIIFDPEDEQRASLSESLLATE